MKKIPLPSIVHNEIFEEQTGLEQSIHKEDKVTLRLLYFLVVIYIEEVGVAYATVSINNMKIIMKLK